MTSLALSENGKGGLRWYGANAIRTRERIAAHLVDAVSSALRRINRAWLIEQCEAPILTPRSQMPAYDSSDIFALEAKIAGEAYALRPETTKGSYAYARQLMLGGMKPPICVWQHGKSFRVEANDGASAAKLRFNEFWQLEFQCIYSPDTKADYPMLLPGKCRDALEQLFKHRTGITTSDRLPSYSEGTLDLMVGRGDREFEVASMSRRNDFEGHKVFEIAFGTDRLLHLFAGMP